METSLYLVEPWGHRSYPQTCIMDRVFLFVLLQRTSLCRSPPHALSVHDTTRRTRLPRWVSSSRFCGTPTAQNLQGCGRGRRPPESGPGASSATLVSEGPSVVPGYARPDHPPTPKAAPLRVRDLVLRVKPCAVGHGDWDGCGRRRWRTGESEALVLVLQGLGSTTVRCRPSFYLPSQELGLKKGINSKL